MTVGYASCVPACIIQARHNKRYMFKNEGSIEAKWTHRSTNPAVNIVFYKPQEYSGEQMDLQSSVTQLDEF